jgi:hypothetical protein
MIIESASSAARALDGVVSGSGRYFTPSGDRYCTGRHNREVGVSLRPSKVPKLDATVEE